MRNEYPLQKCPACPHGSGLAARWDQLYKHRSTAQLLARSSAVLLPGMSLPSPTLSLRGGASGDLPIGDPDSASSQG